MYKLAYGLSTDLLCSVSKKNVYVYYLLSAQIMHWLLLLLVVCGAATAQEGRWCSRDDTASVLSSWSQGMGLDSNGDTGVTIKKATEFFLQYVCFSFVL